MEGEEEWKRVEESEESEGEWRRVEEGEEEWKRVEESEESEGEWRRIYDNGKGMYRGVGMIKERWLRINDTLIIVFNHKGVTTNFI